MKRVLRRAFVITAAVLFLTAFALPAIADSHEEAKPPAYSVIHYDNVEPAMADEYEANTADWAAAFKEAELGAEYSWRMYQGPNFMYAFVTDMPDYAFLDKSEEQEAHVAEALGTDKLAQLFAGVKVTTHHSEIVKRIPELTYLPEGGMGQVGFVRLGKHTVKPGMEGQFKALAAKVHEARMKTGSSVPVLASQIQFGQGTFQFVSLAPDEATFHAAPPVGAMLNEAFGAEEAEALFNQWRDSITGYETSDWQFRPDLSYMPGMYEESDEMKEGSE